MRVHENGEELYVKPLGEVPGFDQLKSSIESTFNLLDPSTITDEEVFAGTHRIVAPNPFATWDQKHTVLERKVELVKITEPLVAWLKTIYPTCTPVLIQCATLPVKAKLLWHIDSYLYQSVSHKVHVPIITNILARYEGRLNGVERSFHFQAGRAYEINNILMHRSINNGSKPRTHVIIDMMEAESAQELSKLGLNFFFKYHDENKQRERDEA